jgi:uncharacterized protein YcbK (DUF882 family)
VALAALVGAWLLFDGLARPLGAERGEERTLALYNIHTKETTRILYKKDGKYIPAAMEKVNWALRDWRRDEATAMDPKLIDLLWEVHRELGSKEPIHVISAYRSRNTNNMLRSTVGGQASESRHIVGKAIDVHFPDVPVKQIRYSALIREQGGVGYYPTSALPFVHLDTDRVRAWPRLPRHELALLFPKGETRHLADDGGSIGPDDVRQARARHRDLATEMAAYHSLRSQPIGRGSTAVAAVEPPKAQSQPVAVAALVPRLKEAPRVVDRPSQLAERPQSAQDRGRFDALNTLAALPPQTASPPLGPKLKGEPQLVSRGTGRLSATGLLASGISPNAVIEAVDQTRFATAPAFDEEHPDELAYRPFPIAPFLTATASFDDPALAVMTHPDHQRTIDLLDAAGGMPPMRLRPTERAAALMMAQTFQGDAVNVRQAFSERDAVAGDAITARRVSTK